MGPQDDQGRDMTAPAFITRDTGPAVEQEIARDMVGRAAWAGPILIGFCGLAWGLDGLLSSGYAVVLVLVNFLLSAAMLSWAARISLALLMGAAMGGYLVRLGLIAGAVLLVKDQPWVSLWAMGLTLIITHLGLLLWELRYVSASLAFPGLKPGVAKENRSK